MIRRATFSLCRNWRYNLVRVWDKSLPRCCFIMLNPSIADDKVDDPTTRRVMNMEKKWGYGSHEAVNLFALVSTDPKGLKSFEKIFGSPVGPRNDEYIMKAVERASSVVVAWGTHGVFHGRNHDVLNMLHGYNLHCLGRTKHGHPRFPLYLPKETELEVFQDA